GMFDSAVEGEGHGMGPDLAEDPTAAEPEDPHAEQLPTEGAIPEGDAVPDDPAGEAAEVPEELPASPLGDETVAGDADPAAPAAGEAGQGDVAVAGFTEGEPISDARVLRTTTEDGRTAIIVLGAGIGGGGAMDGQQGGQ